MANSNSWQKIFDEYEILKHDFSKCPFVLTSIMIKKSVQDFKNTAEKEVRILCKQDSRSDVPDIMSTNWLFLLPVKNWDYVIVKWDWYIDIPDIEWEPTIYNSKIDFELESSKVWNSEMQHLDFAYASSLIRTFMEDPSLVLTIRGRKYTPEFSFNVWHQLIETKSVQTEVDAWYEWKDKIVLIEAKNSKTNNTIIRQLFYPYKQWKTNTKKEVFLLFFEKRWKEYCIWQYKFKDENDYNSIDLVKTWKYIII